MQAMYSRPDRPFPGDRLRGAAVISRLFGRDQEIELIRQAVDDTAAGGGGWHVITGPAGIGKSQLIRVAIELAEERGITVAAREAFRLDQAAPLITLAGALRDCRPATTAFDWLSQPERPDPYQTLQRLRAGLEKLANERPLLIVIDDAQWMDELSALAIRELVPALASFPVRWIFATRQDKPEAPGYQTVNWLLRDGGRPIQLGVLDEAAIVELSADVIGASVDNTVVALAVSCGGHPLRTRQLLTALAATGQLVVSEGIASVVGAELPSSFVDSVNEVLESLSDEAQWLLRASSVFARPFGLDTLGRLIGREPGDLLPAIEEAMTGFLAEDASGGLTFAHDLVRQAVYNRLRMPVREQLHREVATITRDEGRPALEVAEHQLKSGRSGAADAVRMIRSAAREIALVAPGAAADLMLHSVAATGEHDPGRPGMIADAVGLLASAARLEEARRLGEEALRGGLEPETEALLLLGLAEACKHDGVNEVAVTYADRGLADAGVSDAARARLSAIRAHALFYAGDLARADVSGAASDVLGRGSGETGAAVFGLTARSLVAQAEGRLSDALTHARAATDLADREDGDGRQRHPRIWLGSALTMLDRFVDAEATFRRGRREVERLGAAWAEPLWHYFHAALLYARGQLEDAMVEAESGVDVAEQLTAYQMAVPLLGTLIRVAALRGDITQAQNYLAHMRRLTDTGITATPEDVVWPEAMMLDASGSAAGAYALLSDLYDLLPARPLLIATDPAAAATLVGLARAAGRSDHAATVVETARLLSERNPGSHSAAGAAAHAEGRLIDDLERLKQAADEFRQTDRPLALAAALEDAAVAGRNTESRETIQGWYDEALAILVPRGAARARQRLESRLSGWHSASAPPAPAPPPCLPQLSAAERRVAEQVAKGRTNSEAAELLFISTHTVDAHLRHIFKKLGVRRRAELAALVARECWSIP